MTRKTAIK